MLGGYTANKKDDDFGSILSMDLDEQLGKLLPDDKSELTTEKLLEPSRITINYENLVKDAGLKTYMTADINVEPFEIKIGFRELEFFSKLNKNIQEFLLVINDSDD